MYRVLYPPHKVWESIGIGQTVCRQIYANLSIDMTFWFLVFLELLPFGRKGLCTLSLQLFSHLLQYPYLQFIIGLLHEIVFIARAVYGESEKNDRVEKTNNNLFIAIFPVASLFYSQLVPLQTRTKVDSYHRKSTRTIVNSYHRQLVPQSTRTIVNSYQCKLVPS